MRSDTCRPWTPRFVPVWSRVTLPCLVDRYVRASLVPARFHGTGSADDDAFEERSAKWAPAAAEDGLRTERTAVATAAEDEMHAMPPADGDIGNGAENVGTCYWGRAQGNKLCLVLRGGALLREGAKLLLEVWDEGVLSDERVGALLRFSVPLHRLLNSLEGALVSHVCLFVFFDSLVCHAPRA